MYSHYLGASFRFMHVSRSLCFNFLLRKHVRYNSGSAGIQIAASRAGSEESAYTNSDNQRHDLVYAPNATCNDFWLAWPAMQDRAIARGTVVVFDLNDSVGNLFRTLALLMQVRTITSG